MLTDLQVFSINAVHAHDKHPHADLPMPSTSTLYVSTHIQHKRNMKTPTEGFTLRDKDGKRGARKGEGEREKRKCAKGREGKGQERNVIGERG